MAATVLTHHSVAAVEQTGRRRAQLLWAEMPIATRLMVLRQARHELARGSEALVEAISPELARTRADSYGAEVLPLLAACRFLEREAKTILKPRRLGRRGLPFWLAGLESTVERVPMGVALLIAPSNYPLLLAGVQALQALAAGNAVVWKPGRGGEAVAQVFRAALLRAGLPPDLLRVTDDSTETAIAEAQAGPDKIVFTGSGQAGRAVLRLAAEQAIPVTAELSGCDAVVVLESANMPRVVDALAFGMRLNGSATCIAPRRLVLVGDGHEALIAQLQERFAAMDGIDVGLRTRNQLRELIEEAESAGARVCGNHGALMLKPLLLLGGSAEMAIAQADMFAPVLTVIAVRDTNEVLRADAACPFGLAVSIFGAESRARELGRRLEVGTVIVNDLIAPTVDPRIPFGGRRGSGFGATRGAEGLLEMTTAKVTCVRKDNNTRHFQQTTITHEELFRSAIAMSHTGTLRERFAGLRGLVAAARKLK